MIQRLTDIKTDSSAAFEKESKLLLVRVDADCITLALTDKATGEWSAAEILSIDDADWQRDDVVEDLKQKSRLAGFSGLETNIYVSSLKAMLVPTALINDAALFMEVQFGTAEDSPLIDEVDANTRIAFQINSTQKVILSKLFSKAAWFSTLDILISQLKAAGASVVAPVAFLHISNKQAEIAFYQGGSLLLARCFSFSNEEDVLYHLLNACKQLQIDSTQLILKIQGRLTEKDRLFRLLQEYIFKVSFTEIKDENDAISNVAFSQVPQHYLTPLMQEL